MNQRELRLLREAFEMTQEQFAKWISVATSSYKYHETNARPSERINNVINDAINDDVKQAVKTLIEVADKQTKGK